MYNPNIHSILSAQAQVEAIKARIAGMEADNYERSLNNAPPTYTSVDFFHYAENLDSLANELLRYG